MLHPEAFRLLTDEAALSDYQFGSNSCHWLFCRTCGVRSFGPRLHSRDRRALRLGVGLLPGHASPDELIAAPVQYCDGRNNNWSQAPAETRHL